MSINLSGCNTLMTQKNLNHSNVSIILDKVNKLNQDIADVAQHVGLQNPIRKYTEDTSNTPKSDG